MLAVLHYFFPVTCPYNHLTALPTKHQEHGGAVSYTTTHHKNDTYFFQGNVFS